MNDVDVVRAVREAGHSMRPALRSELRSTLEASLRGDEFAETVTIEPLVQQKRVNGRSLALALIATGSLAAATLAVIVLSRDRGADGRVNESPSPSPGAVVETTSSTPSIEPTTVAVTPTSVALPAPSTVLSPYSELASLKESGGVPVDSGDRWVLDASGLLVADRPDGTLVNFVPTVWVRHTNFDLWHSWETRIPTALHRGQQESIWDIAEGPEQVLYVLYQGVNEPQWSLAAFDTRDRSVGVLIASADNVFGPMAAMPAETLPRLLEFMKSDGIDFKTAAASGAVFPYLDPTTGSEGPSLADPLQEVTVVHEPIELPRDAYDVVDSAGNDLLKGERIQVISGSQRWTFDALGLVHLEGQLIGAFPQRDGSVVVHLKLYQSAAQFENGSGGLVPAKRVLGLLRPDGTMTFWSNDPTATHGEFNDVVTVGDEIVGLARVGDGPQAVLVSLSAIDVAVPASTEPSAAAWPGGD